MRDAPEFVERAERLAKHAADEVDAIRAAVGTAKERPSPAARTELLGAASALRQQASYLDLLVGHVEGQMYGERLAAQRATAALPPVGAVRARRLGKP